MAYLTDRHVFIHIYKTGGNSIRKMLPPGIEIGGVHSCAPDVLKDTRTKGKFMFSVVRDPYRWTYSLYTYIKRTGHPLSGTVNSMSFYEFVKYLRDVLMKREWKSMGNNYTSQTTATQGCDKVYRLEDIIKDSTQFCKELSIPVQKIPFHNSNPDQSVQECRLSRDLIQEIFADDYQNFGYDIK